MNQEEFLSIIPSGVDLAGYSNDVVSFVRSFEQLAVALGGQELLVSCRDEIKYNMDRGADLVEAFDPVYTRIRALAH